MVESVARAMFVAGWPHQKEREEHEAKNGIDGYRKLAQAALTECIRLGLLSSDGYARVKAGER